MTKYLMHTSPDGQFIMWGDKTFDTLGDILIHLIKQEDEQSNLSEANHHLINKMVHAQKLLFEAGRYSAELMKDKEGLQATINVQRKYLQVLRGSLDDILNKAFSKVSRVNKIEEPSRDLDYYLKEKFKK